MFNGTQSGNDWISIRDAIKAVATDWRNNNLDSELGPRCGSLDPTQIRSANMPQDVILQHMQSYQPAFSSNDVQRCLAFIDQQSRSDIQRVTSRIQQYGMSDYFSQAARQAELLAMYCDNRQGGSAPSSRFHTNAARPAQPPPNEGGGYNCKTDGALVFSFGIAFTTIAIMTMGAGAPLAAGFWVTIGTWGSIGASGWGAGHAMTCGF